jgi:hypothetical protein
MGAHILPEPSQNAPVALAPKKTFIKVNVAVDAGIARFAAALSTIDDLEILEASEGGIGRDAHVIFRLGDWRTAGAFLFDQLMPAFEQLRQQVSLSLQAYDETGALAQIEIATSALDEASNCVELISGLSAALGEGAPSLPPPRRAIGSEANRGLRREWPVLNAGARV